MSRRLARRPRALALAAAAAAVALGWLCFASSAALAGGAGRARVVVWPQGLGEDGAAAAAAAIAPVAAAVRSAGFEPVSDERLRERLRALGDRAAAAEGAALDAVQAALAAARARYLAQDAAAMAALLERAERDALPVLAQPRHAPVLWELALQRGLAELLRREPDAARARFALALALDEARAPRRELYGPAVARAFAEVADARGQLPPRPTPLRVDPPDARVAIDGLPVIDNAAPRMLRPGLHAVAVSAPGYRAHAAIVDVAPGAPIRIALAPAGGDAVERLGAEWGSGLAEAGTASGRRALAAVAAELGAAAVLVVELDRGRGGASARVIAGPDASRATRGATAAAAAAAALAHLAPGGSIRPDAVAPGGSGGSGGSGDSGGSGGDGRGGRGAAGSILRSWWLWAAVGGVAAAIGVGAVIDSQRDRTIRILPPAP